MDIEYTWVVDIKTGETLWSIKIAYMELIYQSVRSFIRMGDCREKRADKGIVIQPATFLTL